MNKEEVHYLTAVQHCTRGPLEGNNGEKMKRNIVNIGKEFKNPIIIPDDIIF